MEVSKLTIPSVDSGKYSVVVDYLKYGSRMNIGERCQEITHKFLRESFVKNNNNNIDVRLVVYNTEGELV